MTPKCREARSHTRDTPNHAAFKSLADIVGTFKETDISEILSAQLAKPIELLNITDYPKAGLSKIDLNTVAKALNASEGEFQKIMWVGPKRSMRMMNVVVASVLEYLSG